MVHNERQFRNIYKVSMLKGDTNGSIKLERRLDAVIYKQNLQLYFQPDNLLIMGM